MLMELEFIFMSVYKDKLIMIFFKMWNPKVNKIFCSYILMLVIYFLQGSVLWYIYLMILVWRKKQALYKGEF